MPVEALSTQGQETAPSTLILGSVQTKAMHPYPTADANGTISMTEAIMFATTSAEGFMDHFMDTYKHFTLSERVDLGELEKEHTDWCLDRIAALVFD